LVLKEALGLIICGGLNLSKSGVLAALAGLTTTESDAPEEDEDMANDHTDQTNSNTNHDSDEDWDEDVHHNTTEESTEAAVSVVVAIWSVWAIWTMSMRTVMFTMVAVMFRSSFRLTWMAMEFHRFGIRLAMMSMVLWMSLDWDWFALVASPLQLG
jgi:uncharacterized membrane protein YgcG